MNIYTLSFYAYHLYASHLYMKKTKRQIKTTTTPNNANHPHISGKKTTAIIDQTKITITGIVDHKRSLNHIKKRSLNHSLLKIFFTLLMINYSNNRRNNIIFTTLFPDKASTFLITQTQLGNTTFLFLICIALSIFVETPTRFALYYKEE